MQPESPNEGWRDVELAWVELISRIYLLMRTSMSMAV